MNDTMSTFLRTFQIQNERLLSMCVCVCVCVFRTACPIAKLFDICFIRKSTVPLSVDWPLVICQHVFRRTKSIFHSSCNEITVWRDAFKFANRFLTSNTFICSIANWLSEIRLTVIDSLLGYMTSVVTCSSCHFDILNSISKLRTNCANGRLHWVTTCYRGCHGKGKTGNFNVHFSRQGK